MRSSTTTRSSLVGSLVSLGLGLGLATGIGCQAQRQASQDVPRTAAPPGGKAPPAAPVSPEGHVVATPPAPAEAPQPQEQALVVENGQERFIDAAKAEADGYTLIDLSDDFTPYIFAEQVSAQGTPLPNRYRRVFIGLANDKLDEDGQPLQPGQKNYLELYGIFPSFSVLRARFHESMGKTCIDEAGKAALEAVPYVSYVAPAALRRDDLRIAKLRKELDAARRKARVKTLAELAEKNPTLAPKVKLVEKRAADKLALAAVEKRLHCEGLLKPGSGHKPGIYDEPIQQVVKSFQQKHMIYEANFLRRSTMDALERDLLDNDHRSLMRSLRERVVAAAAILEDGTVGPTVLGESSNLADEYTNVAVKALGIDTPEGAAAFMKRRGPQDFQHLRAAVKLPPRPDYYGPKMDLQVVIDRGDVYYELPFDEKNERIPQVRKKFPSFTLVLNQGGGKKLPLVKWRTTIGGWRAEQATDGYEYYRYKGSDVGDRVIRKIVAGPVWIAPESTPIRSLLKPKLVGPPGAMRREHVVNYSELGPGFLSAYGLVAGYFVVARDGKADWDNGIRAHGSAEYLSMYSPTGYSHGCHRLPNHLAIRLYSFILRHRNVRVAGDLPLDKARQFLKAEDVYEMRLPSQGYGYFLDPPLPVTVLEGEIKGDQKEPIMGYVPKPGQQYPGPPPALPGESPEERAGGGGGGGKPGDKPAEEDPPEAKL
jgi:hypothetical protein